MAWAEKQILCEDDNQKSKGKGNDRSRSFPFGKLRVRMTSFIVVRRKRSFATANDTPRFTPNGQRMSVGDPTLPRDEAASRGWGHPVMRFSVRVRYYPGRAPIILNRSSSDVAPRSAALVTLWAKSVKSRKISSCVSVWAVLSR